MGKGEGQGRAVSINKKLGGTSEKFNARAEPTKWKTAGGRSITTTSLSKRKTNNQPATKTKKPRISKKKRNV